MASKFRSLLEAALLGYFSASNKKTCEQCEGVGSLFTQSGTLLECEQCFGSGWVFILSPFASIGGGVAGNDARVSASGRRE